MEDSSAWSEYGSRGLDPRFPPGLVFKISEDWSKMEILKYACSNKWWSTLFAIQLPWFSPK